MGAKEKLVELLKQFTENEDEQKEIVEAIDTMAEEIAEETRKEFGEDHEETARVIQKLTDQRDEVLARAQEAENQLQENLEAHAEEIDNLKARFRKDHREKMQEVLAQNETLEKEKDELALQIRQEYDEAREADRNAMIETVSGYLERKGTKFAESIRAEIENDPAHIGYAGTIQKIAELVNDVASKHSEIGETHPRLKELREQLDAVQAEKVLIESRNVRLVAENKLLKENRLEDEDEGELKNKSVESGKKNIAEDSPKGSASRAKDLLSEAFNDDLEESDSWIGEKENLDDDKERRRNRAEEVSGLAEVFGEEDLVREIAEGNKSNNQDAKAMNERFVTGTGSSQNESLRLAGIK